MSLNFKQDTWEGKVIDLLEELYEQAYPQLTLIDIWADWTESRVSEDYSPFRKFRSYPARGAIIDKYDNLFTPVDNEVLISIYQFAFEGKGPDSYKTWVELYEDPDIRFSFRVDTEGNYQEFINQVCSIKKGLRKSILRGNSSPEISGLKLAHIKDAGQNIQQSGYEGLKERASKSMSLRNVFPFPNSKHVNFYYKDVEKRRKDLAEVPAFQELMEQFIKYKRGNCSVEELPAIGQKEILIKPKKEDSTLKGKKEKSKSSKTTVGSPEYAVDKFGKKEVLDIADMIELFKVWLESTKEKNPERIDGEIGSNKTGRSWVHFKVSGFNNSFKKFEGSDGQLWDAVSYNGVYAFNGDTTRDAIVRMVRLYDETVVDDIDLFKFSETYAGKELPSNVSERKRKLALKDDSSVDGFFAYFVSVI